jgi:predicted TPR repeat methyltransferase
MNKAVAARSPWLNFLREKKYLEQVGNILRKAGEEYRQLHGVNPKTKTAAERRITKLQRAIEAVQDANINKRLGTEFGDRYNTAYVNAVVDRLNKEIASLKKLIAYGAEKLSTEEKKTGSGYGLLSGLGYDEGYGYFY